MESTIQDANGGGGTCMADNMSVMREPPISIEFMNELVDPSGVNHGLGFIVADLDHNCWRG
jgi:hypothetical protein